MSQQPRADNASNPAPSAAPNPPFAQARTQGGRKLLLVVSAALLVAWLGWLSYTALTKSRAPTVSHVQAAAAEVAVVAEVTTGEADRSSFLLRQPGNIEELKARGGKPAFVVTVVERLTGEGPAEGTQIGVTNLPGATGYDGPGRYLLLLLSQKSDARLDNHPAYELVGPQSSPGAGFAEVGPPKIYPWSDDVRKQVAKLYPRAGLKAGEK